MEADALIAHICHQAMETIIQALLLVYDQNFYGGVGVVDGEGGSSERCLKGMVGGWGSLRDLSKTS